MKSALLLIAILFCVALASGDKVLGKRSRTNFPKPWTIGAIADPTDDIRFIVALKQKNLDALESKFWAVSDPVSPDYRNFMTIEEITAMVAPEPSDVSRVYNWLIGEGVKRSDIRSSGDSLSVKTTVQVASRLFDTEFHYFHHAVKGRKIVRQLGEFSVPSHVADIVEMVSGLSEFPANRFSLRASPNSAVTIAPQSLNAIYKVPATAKVTGNSSAGPIEWDDQYFAPSDLDQFSQLFTLNIPPVSAKHIVGTNDPTNPKKKIHLLI